MFFNGIAIFFYPYTIEGWWLNKIQEGNPILLLGHPHIYTPRSQHKLSISQPHPPIGSIILQ